MKKKILSEDGYISHQEPENEDEEKLLSQVAPQQHNSEIHYPRVRWNSGRTLGLFVTESSAFKTE